MKFPVKSANRDNRSPFLLAGCANGGKSAATGSAEGCFNHRTKKKIKLPVMGSFIFDYL
jgi:hypothetical protein